MRTAEGTDDEGLAAAERADDGQETMPVHGVRELVHRRMPTEGRDSRLHGGGNGGPEWWDGQVEDFTRSDVAAFVESRSPIRRAKAPAALQAGEGQVSA